MRGAGKVETVETVGCGRRVVAPAARANHVRGGVTADEQAAIGLATLTLSLSPGDAVARGRLVRVRAGLIARLAVEDAGYVAVAEIGAVLDRDMLAWTVAADMAENDTRLGPGSRQDPVVHLYKLGRLDDDGLRAAREIQQVAEWVAVGGVGGVKAMDPAAIRVDGGGGAGRMDLATYRAGHHAAGRVGDFMAALASDSRRFKGRDGRVWSDADIFRAVVVERWSRLSVEKKVVADHRTVTALVVGWLAAYVSEAKDIWAVMDGVKARHS